MPQRAAIGVTVSTPGTPRRMRSTSSSSKAHERPL